MFDFLKRRSGRKDRVEVIHWSSNEVLRNCLRSLRGECTVADAPHQEAAAAAVFLAQQGSWTPVDSIPGDWTEGKCYILWEDDALPCLRCTCRTALDHIGAVKAVSPDVCLVSENMDRILHFCPDGTLRLHPEA